MMGSKAPRPKLIAIVRSLASSDPELGIERFDISDPGQRDASVEMGVVDLSAICSARLALVFHAPPSQAVVEGCRPHCRYITALGAVRRRAPWLEVDGEMHGGANIAHNLLRTAAAGGIAIGPILLGAVKPVHILTASAIGRRIVNLPALTVAEINVSR